MSGINDRVQLAAAAKAMQKRINEKLMLSGVTIEDPDTAYIGPYVSIAPDTIVKPNTTILGKTTIGAENVIGPNSYLENVTVWDDGFVICSHVVDSTLGDKVQAGPYARIRGKAVLHDEAHVGNFLELKNGVFGAQSKALHLSYLGDAPNVESANL